MFHHPITRKARRPAEADVPFTDRFFDTLYQYLDLIGPKADKALASFDCPPEGKVAIIGAGAAGMCAGYELLKTGVVPTILEASNRVGGRADSRPWPGVVNRDGANVFAELGSMRVPRVHVCFFAYANKFGMTRAKGGFPDPGVVDTLLQYQGQLSEWLPGTDPPGQFAKISSDFDAFMEPFSERIYSVWGDWDQVAIEWQKLIDRYHDVSFYQAVVEGIPQWGLEEYNAFGTLGVGSGGFGPLFQIDFLEMLRVIVNGWETDQQLFVQGMEALPRGFYAEKVDAPFGLGRTSLEEQRAVLFQTPVRAARYDHAAGRPELLYRAPGDAHSRWHAYDAVIVATTTRAMQMIDLTLTPPEQHDHPEHDLVSAEARVGIETLHMTSSSKMFVVTEQKFWQNHEDFFPQVILTDQIPRAAYCLDYPDTDRGVVCISYTWEDDSLKLMALPVEERFHKLKNVLAHASPEFANYLVPIPGTEIYNVDWDLESGYYGAFKLNYPGQEPYCQEVYYQFQTALEPERDRGLYLASDGVSWAGGWTEGALHTGLNAACAVAHRLGGRVVADSPLTAQPADRYNYAGKDGRLRARGFVR